MSEAGDWTVSGQEPPDPPDPPDHSRTQLINDLLSQIEKQNRTIADLSKQVTVLTATIASLKQPHGNNKKSNGRSCGLSKTGIKAKFHAAKRQRKPPPDSSSGSADENMEFDNSSNSNAIVNSTAISIGSANVSTAGVLSAATVCQIANKNNRPSTSAAAIAHANQEQPKNNNNNNNLPHDNSNSTHSNTNNNSINEIFTNSDVTNHGPGFFGSFAHAPTSQGSRYSSHGVTNERPVIAGSSNNTTNISNNATNGNNNNNGVSPRPSPIQLGQMERSQFSALLSKMTAAFDVKLFRWQQLKDTSLPRIFAADHEAKARIIDWLHNNHVPHNTYAERGQRRKAFIVRGLAHGEPNEMCQIVHSAVASAGVRGDFTVRPFQTGYMKRNANSNQTPLYQVTVAHDVPDSYLAAIKLIGCFAVRFERMKPSSVIQCRRCQRYAHTATMCAHDYRCVQCVDAHAPGCCPRATNKSTPVACCNCKAAGLVFVGHTANDINCCNYYRRINAGKAMNAPRNTASHGARNPQIPAHNHIIEAVHANGPSQRRSATTAKTNNNNINSNKKNKNNKNKNQDQPVRGARGGPNSQVSGNSYATLTPGDALIELVSALTSVLDRFRQCQLS